MTTATKTRKATSIDALAAQLAAQAPDGWTVTSGTGWHDGFECWTRDVDEANKYRHVLYQKDGVGIVLNVRAITSERFSAKWERERAFSGHVVEGHTTFDGRTFTRRGVDCESCTLCDDAAQRHDHDYGSVPELLTGEYDRCLKARARHATAVPVPGLPFSVQPDWFAATAASLQAGKPVSLAPAGFGTGYTLRKGLPRRTRGYTDVRRADPALEARLGVGPVSVEPFDHD
jgi:hypothetical protein